MASITIRNLGLNIPEGMIDRIFEYGLSDQQGSGANGSRGQGVFVDRTYMARMGGTITAQNEVDGVSFVLILVWVL